MSPLFRCNFQNGREKVVNSEKELILDGEKDNFNVSRPRIICPSFICPIFSSVFFISLLPTFCLVAALRLSVFIFFLPQLLAAHSAVFRLKHKVTYQEIIL